MSRKTPRPFQMPWGRGQIVEEISIECPHWEPTIQLMEYEDGSRSLRFCYYSEGRFGRGPVMLNEEDIMRMAAAIGDTSQIKDLFSRLAGTG